jgi:hypothetical protein
MASSTAVDILGSSKIFYILIFVTAFCFNLLRIAQISHSKVHIWRKILGFVLEFLHNLYIAAIIVGLFWLNFQVMLLGSYNTFGLIFINIGVLFAYMLYGFLRTCLFFLFFNRTLGFHDCGEYYSVVDMFKGQKILEHGRPNCEKNNNKWIIGVRLLTVFTVILDIMYLDHFWSLTSSSPRGVPSMTLLT